MSSKIKDGLFMGDVDAAQDAEFLQLNGIVRIINCVPREVPNVFQQSLGLTYTACDLGEVLQRPFFDLQNREFMGLVQGIECALEKTESVLVHSLDGFCRSPSIIIGYLMVKYCWGLDKAHDFVVMKRPDIKLHESFVKQLADLETQLQKSYLSRATEQQLYEWSPRAADPKTDESVLVHTFLNSSSRPKSDRELLSRQQKEPTKQRRLTWIDQSAELTKLYPSLLSRLERPPNCSYNGMRAANGWVDLLEPANTQSEIRKVQATSSARNMVDGVRQAFADVSLTDQAITGTPAIPHQDFDDDVFDAERSRPTKKNLRALSFSAPKQSYPEQQDLSSYSIPQGNDYDDDELQLSSGKLAPKSTLPRYLQETQSSISARPRRSLRPGATMYRADPGAVYGRTSTTASNMTGTTVTGATTGRAVKSTSKASSKRLTKASHLASRSALSSTTSVPGVAGTSKANRMFLDVEFSATAPIKAGNSGAKAVSMSARSARHSLNDPFDRAESSAPTRPRTAPARPRRDTEDRNNLYGKIQGSAGGVTSYAPSNEPTASATFHRLHASFDYGSLGAGKIPPSISSTVPTHSLRRSTTATASSFSRTRSSTGRAWK